MFKNQTHLKIYLSIIMCLIFLLCCKDKVHKLSVSIEDKQEPISEAILNNGPSIKARFIPPEGYIRNEKSNSDFASYLRNFPLLDTNEKVHLFNGSLKSDQSVHAAILDIDVGDRDLQQCADAIMRLRAEYLYKHKKYNDIAFDFTNGWRFEYSKWRAGNDLIVEGNNTTWKMGDSAKESYKDFRAYMDLVFMYAGTLSLSKELQSREIENMEISDLFIKGGSPGHAVVVVDLAINEETGDKAFLLAQSYMPAQQIHVLKNPTNSKMSPWYLLSEIEVELITPEWTFDRNTLMQF